MIIDNNQKNEAKVDFLANNLAYSCTIYKE